MSFFTSSDQALRNLAVTKKLFDHVRAPDFPVSRKENNRAKEIVEIIFTHKLPLFDIDSGDQILYDFHIFQSPPFDIYTGKPARTFTSLIGFVGYRKRVEFDPLSLKWDWQ